MTVRAADSAPLLSASGVRIDVDGAVAVLDASFEARGRSLALVGDASAWLAAIGGAARVRAGSLRVVGLDVATGEHLGAVGLAPLDPPLPAKWTVAKYASAGARLAGLSTREARSAVERTLAALGLASLARSRLGALPVPERRAVAIAQAVVADPPVLVCAAPLAGLAGPSAELVARALAAACAGRRFITSLARTDAGSPEHALAASADEVVVLASGHVVRAGNLGSMERQASSYALTVARRAAELSAALSARGVRLAGGPLRFFVELPDGMSTGDLLGLAADVGAPIVELSPRMLFAPTTARA